MKNYFLTALCICICTGYGCSSSRNAGHSKNEESSPEIKSTVSIKTKVPAKSIDVKGTEPGKLVRFAESLRGVPYRYGSTKKENGFDCSGFVFYVFNHFKITVPRTSAEYTNAGKEVSIKNSKPGDLILFTGYNSKSRVVGHLGIVTKSSRNEFKFIHAVAGKGNGVIISEMNSYFIPRFVKVIRVF